jgi:aminoglycoside N3'-acetyltransferase
MSGDYSTEGLVRALRKVGVRPGAIVHVHSALFSLGVLTGKTAANVPEEILDAFRTVIGPTGTVTVPTAFEDFARFGTPYDCRRSPVDLGQGVLSQYIAGRPDAVRTYCPMASVTAVGPRAAEICHQPTGSAFGTGSSWEKLYELDAQFCFLGVRPSRAFTFVVFIQFRQGVPYFYNKLYRTPVYEEGKPVDYPVICPVRYLDPRFRISEDCVPFETHLTSLGLVRCEKIGRGHVFLMDSARTIFNEGAKMLQENLFYFLKQPPLFINGEIPTDGPTGKFIPDERRFRNDQEKA